MKLSLSLKHILIINFVLVEKLFAELVYHKYHKTHTVFNLLTNKELKS